MAGGLKQHGSVKNTPPTPPTPPPTKSSSPPTLAELRQKLAELIIERQQLITQMNQQPTGSPVKGNAANKLKEKNEEITKTRTQIKDMVLRTKKSSSSSSDSSSSSGGDTGDGDKGGGGGSNDDPVVKVKDIIDSYMTDELQMTDGSDDYKKIYLDLKDLLTGSATRIKESFKDNDATCGASGQPADNNALFQDFQQFIDMHQAWKHGSAGRIDAMIKEAMAHYTSPETFQKFDQRYKAWLGAGASGASGATGGASEGDPKPPTPEGQSELEKERAKIEKSGNAAVGSTAQQQLADQIQQDLVGILPEGSTLKEGEDPAKDSGKTYQKGQTDPNSVPTGVAAATNPFIGKASTSGSYGQLNYAQVSGTPQRKDEYDKQGNIIRTLYNDTMEGRQGQTFTYPTVRPEYMILGENDLAMSAYEQLRGDIEFDLFSVVKEGHGLGATNSLYLDNKRNEWGVRFKPKLFVPRAWLGHELGVVPPRKEVQAVMSPETIAAGPKRAKRLLNDEMNYVRTLPGAASAGFLPDDNNRMQSSTGLGTTKPSPFLPHIDTHYYWQRQFDPAGVHMQSRKFRKLYDPLRQPQKNSPAQSGRARPQRTRRHPITYDIY